MKLEGIAEKMTNLDLVICIKEIEEFHNTGILKEGKVRTFSDIIEGITKNSSIKLQLAEDILLREAARRFADSYEV